MLDVEIASVLKRAYEDAQAAQEYNRDREPSIRPSRAGLPLIQLVLEDIVLPKLPKPPQQQWMTKVDPYVATMRLSIGHLFEKTVEQLLRQTYNNTSTQVVTQEVLTLGDMQGSCDILVIDHEQQWATVVECKALKVKFRDERQKSQAITEVKEEKLLCDNWGYLTQLALYVLAVQQKYPRYQVTGCWYVWMKQLEQHAKVALSLSQAELDQVLADVQTKTQHYLEFKRDFEEGKLSYACGKLLQRTVDLPRKIDGGGYLKGSCSLHFNRYCELLTKVDGTLLDNAEDLMLLLTRAAYFGEGECLTEVKKLMLDKRNKLS